MKTIKPVLLLLVSQLLLSYGYAFSDTSIIKAHLTALTKTDTSRSYNHLRQLNKTVDYIHSVFKQYSDSIELQHFKVNKSSYTNIICSFGTENKNRIIIGAHYDVCGNQQGADDNASGVTGLLELARLLKGKKLSYRIDLVSYSLEEPPYFGTKDMGSYIHAKSLFQNKVNVLGMISLEMIGYFSDKENSQSYPEGIPSSLYGTKGDFIALVNKSGSGKFIKSFCSEFISSKQIKTVEISLPETFDAIHLSDHINYWQFGYDAMMITDTSFYRNKNYHQSTDTMETLDIYRMSKVIDGIFSALTSL